MGDDEKKKSSFQMELAVTYSDFQISRNSFVLGPISNPNDLSRILYTVPRHLRCPYSRDRGQSIRIELPTLIVYLLKCDYCDYSGHIMSDNNDHILLDILTSPRYNSGPKLQTKMTDPYGLTALHYAVMLSNFSAVKTIVEHQGDPRKKCKPIFKPKWSNFGGKYFKGAFSAYQLSRMLCFKSGIKQQQQQKRQIYEYLKDINLTLERNWQIFTWFAVHDESRKIYKRERDAQEKLPQSKRATRDPLKCLVDYKLCRLIVEFY